jgi:glycosyltransferase involved in cell wall biosynthesis
VNILFVNYGDFTSNSLNHIAGFARTLAAQGHACIVAVPEGIETVSAIPEPRFTPAIFADLLARPAAFPDGRPADLIHAWTPREVVRRFVLAYQPHARARLVVHLEDNEDFLLAAWLHAPVESVRDVPESDLAEKSSLGLSHPRRYRQFLRVADGVTHIIGPLAGFIPAGVPALELPPGVDPALYAPQPPDAALRRELGLRDGERVITFTGSITFANEAEMRDLYAAVALLNARGTPTRLIRTGLTLPAFQDSLTPAERAAVLELGFVAKAKLPKLLALADVLVQPGRAGPFNDYRLPSKLPEFLSAGRPVVLPATNLARELRDGTDALHLRTCTAAEIADLCERVFRDPALAKKLGTNAAAFARKHFDPAAIGTRLETFYRQLAALPPGPGATATVAEGESEITLSLRRLAADTPAVAELVPLVASLERGDASRAEHARLEREASHWRMHRELAEKHAAQCEEKARLAGEHAAHLAGRLSLAEQHALNLGQEIKAAQAQLREVQARHAEEARLTRQHVANLEQIRDALQRRVNELDAHLATATQARDAAQARVRNMQASFSWQVTMPLRWLRRTFVDPLQRKPAGIGHKSQDTGRPTLPLASRPSPLAPGTPETGVAVWHSVDYPQSWSLPPRTHVLRGWCFADDARKLAGIRAVLPDRIVEGTYGLKRLDVLASVRDKPQAEYCGWRLELELREGDTLLDLEARDAEGRWHRFFHADVKVGEGLGAVDLTSYEKWIEVYDRLTPERLRAQAEESARLPRRPLISVLVPVYNTPECWLVKAVESVRNQSYPHWELCLADDASPQPHVRPLLERFAREDARIKVAFREKNGHISACSNSALELATGEFTALLDHDDELTPHALFEVASLLNAHPDTDYVYSDEDKIDEDGRRHEPYFKPDYLPDLFLAQNYTSHLSVYRTALVREVGGFRAGYEGSQDWDLALRVVDRSAPERIRHIPKVLYHWRAIPGSTALLISEKNYPLEAARRALTDHFARLKQPVSLEHVPGDHWRVIHPLPSPPPPVTLVIPTRNGLKFLQRCVDSILDKTAYPAFEVLVMDNGSDDPATLAYLKQLSDGTHPLLRPGHTARVLRHDAPFNYSVINNRGVREARGEVVGLLNNDLEVINPGWLAEMVAQAVRPGIGCVGAMLYYPNDTIQHAGVVVGLGGVAGHAFRDFPRGSHGKFNRARLVQNYSAVTAACLLVRKSTYEQVGGLDEKELAVAFNDIDFCLKVQAAGYRNLWTPFAEFYHHESATRGPDDNPEKAERFRREVETMLLRWGPALTNDPAYNPNLTLELNDFSLAVPPRIK